MGIFGLFRKKADAWRNSDVYRQLCSAAGFGGPVDPVELTQFLYKKDQEDLAKHTYLSNWRNVFLHNIAELVEKNYAAFMKDLLDVLKMLSDPLFLYYQHAAQSAITNNQLNDAKLLVARGLKYQSISHTTMAINPSLQLMQFYLERNMGEFEVWAKKARGTNWGWDGQDIYEHPLLLLMHKILQGYSYDEARAAFEVYLKKMRPAT